MTPDTVLTLLLDHLDIVVDNADTDLIDGDLVDSLGFMTLFGVLEDTAGVVVGFDDLDLETFRTPRRIATFITTRSNP